MHTQHKGAVNSAYISGPTWEDYMTKLHDLHVDVPININVIEVAQDTLNISVVNEVEERPLSQAQQRTDGLGRKPVTYMWE